MSMNVTITDAEVVTTQIGQMHWQVPTDRSIPFSIQFFDAGGFQVGGPTQNVTYYCTVSSVTQSNETWSIVCDFNVTTLTGTFNFPSNMLGNYFVFVKFHQQFTLEQDDKILSVSLYMNVVEPGNDIVLFNYSRSVQLLQLSQHQFGCTARSDKLLQCDTTEHAGHICVWTE